MDFMKDIVQPLQERLARGVLGTFYDRRRTLKGRKVKRAVLLSEIKNDEAPRRGYAYHRGGRSELQFNIGFEEEGAFFRFGVAYSIQTGPYMDDPVDLLSPSIERFNALIGTLDMQDLSMWRYEDGYPHDPGPIHAIPPEWVRKGVFVFIGQRVPLGADGVTPSMLNKAAAVLERLWMLYERVEGSTPVVQPIPSQRVARVCWNDSDWTQPSGRTNKSRDPKSFEGQHGYGHEEWLFDFDHSLDGWQYGFIQGIKPAHRGRVFDLMLYTIHDPSSVRYWVGHIDRVEVLDDDAALVATRRLEAGGALQRMREEVKALDLNPVTLEGGVATAILNVRFKTSGAELYDTPVPFGRNELPMGRYIIQTPKHDQLALYRPGPARDAVFKRRLHTAAMERTTHAGRIYVDPVHAKWQERLEVTVPEDLPGATAHAERAVEGHSVDLVIEHLGLKVFVEIKTDPSTRKVIRAALSQLMEYAYHPDATRCDALLIAGALPATDEDAMFLAMLRERFNIPVHFLHIVDGRLVGLSALWKALLQPSADKDVKPT